MKMKMISEYTRERISLIYIKGNKIYIKGNNSPIGEFNREVYWKRVSPTKHTPLLGYVLFMVDNYIGRYNSIELIKLALIGRI